MDFGRRKVTQYEQVVNRLRHACYTDADMADVVHLPNLFETVVRRACVLVPKLAHVDPSKILVLAYKLPPTRLGQTIGFRQQRRPMRAAESDALYAISFSARLVAAGCLPAGRQAGSSAYNNRTVLGEHDALDTVMHELWHVSDACDGTIRPMRHGATFNAIVRTMRRTYLNAGGESLPMLEHDVRVRVRQMDRRPRLGMEIKTRERVTTLARLIPSTVTYSCPFGHVATRHRRISRPSSCATCSPTFDPRYLLREVTA